jgi:hypothetical protein
MDIKKMMAEYHDASAEQKKVIENRIQSEYSTLSDSGKKDVQRLFLDDIDEKVTELKEVVLKEKLQRISGYIYLSYIARTFFGKSRQWLNNRIKVNMVNGKPASFTKQEMDTLSNALLYVSDEIGETARSI